MFVLSDQIQNGSDLKSVQILCSHFLTGFMAPAGICSMERVLQNKIFILQPYPFSYTLFYGSDKLVGFFKVIY